MKPRAIVVLSGGQDSTTCLYKAQADGFEVHAITFDYNQRHAREIESAKEIAARAGVASHEIIELGPVLAGTSPITNPEEVLEQYEHHSLLPGGLEKTFVPGRNLLFLSIAANRAYVLGCQAVITGVAQEDFGGYPDCRRKFIDSLEQTIKEGVFTDAEFWIETPLMDLSKAETVKLALELPGCYAALALTHTSYDGAYPPTGHDHATLMRAKGFEEAGVPDPLVLRAWRDGLMNLPDTANYDSGKVTYYSAAAGLT